MFGKAKETGGIDGKLTSVPILLIPAGIAGNILFFLRLLSLLPSLVEKMFEELKLGGDEAHENEHDTENGLHRRCEKCPSAVYATRMEKETGGRDLEVE